LVCAAVYGAVWQYCQMKDGACKASLNKLGKGIGVDRATVMRSIKKLCDLGYLTDQTPDRRNAPHVYTLSKTVALCNSLGDQDSQPDIQTVAERNATVAERNATVAESHLKKSFKKTTKNKKEGSARKVKASPAEKKQKVIKQDDPLLVSVLKACKMEIGMMTTRQFEAATEAYAKLSKRDIKPETVLRFSEWWIKHDWRGQKGGKPTPLQVIEEWIKFEDWEKSDQQNGTTKTSPAAPEGSQYRRDTDKLYADLKGKKYGPAS